MPATARILLAGALFATGGALIKSCELPSLQRAALRAFAAAITIFALLPAARRWPDRRILALLPAYFLATCCFVVANSLTTAASTVFLQSTSPLWVLIIGPVWLGERATRRDLMVLVGVTLGMTLCFLAPGEALATAPHPRLGDALALLSGIGFAWLLLGMRRLANDGQDCGAAIAAWGNLVTCPAAFLLMPLFDQTATLGTLEDWLLMITLGIFQVGFAYVILVRALPQVPAMQTSLLLMIEPALNPLIAFAVHLETPPQQTILGGVFIIGSVATGSLLHRRS
jgi:drug/metabolite transporter, DME family